MSIAHLAHKGEETALKAFKHACVEIDAAARGGLCCDDLDLEAARAYLRMLGEVMAGAQAAIRGKESRRPL